MAISKPIFATNNSLENSWRDLLTSFCTSPIATFQNIFVKRFFKISRYNLKENRKNASFTKAFAIFADLDELFSSGFHKCSRHFKPTIFFIDFSRNIGIFGETKLQKEWSFDSHTARLVKASSSMRKEGHVIVVVHAWVVPQGEWDLHWAEMP